MSRIDAASQGRFLPKVGVATGDDRPLPRAANGAFGALPAVHAALPGADIARLQALVCLLDPLLQLAGAEEVEVCGFEVDHLISCSRFD